ncbi:MAG: site-specific DNA-methyltransferase [Glaciimonas sp.]|nr:site-specific DNA-methyltransferase [Glaciimonas sp.]
MGETRQRALQAIILKLLPEDCSFIGNKSLLQLACNVDGVDASEEELHIARDALLASGSIIKGKGRGGSTARAAGEARPDFALKAEVTTTDLFASQLASKPAAKPRKLRAAPQAASGEPQVLSYRHSERRKNNPEVGLVNEASDPETPKTVWNYDPHLDPALQFDSARAGAEKLIDDALAGDDPAAMRSALEQLRRLGSPYLQWSGKAERTSFEVDTVSLHVHERIDAMSILSAVSKRQGSQKDGKAASGGFQASLFEAPFESLPLRSAVDFYKHDRGWANRLVAGDSLLVMNSLLQKEGMAGQVQMIYIDPPYGIKYGSNFQPFTNKRDVKDRSDADLTQEPEMIKAFRDTWELGIHSYLTYLRDRLLLAKDLLSETGSVFVQISDENLHHVREMLDEIFGSDNFLSVITTKKTGGMGEQFIDNVSDYVVWYCCSKQKAKFNRLYLPKALGIGGGARYNQIQEADGRVRAMSKLEKEDSGLVSKDCRAFLGGPLTSETASESTTFDFNLKGRPIQIRKGGWKTGKLGMNRLIASNRLVLTKEFVNYKMFVDDFPAFVLSNLWSDTMGTAEQDKSYVVQTTTKVIERCMLMTTDPGDLVLDPTCGSGTTAYVAEKWGRRWITCDTSRVAITLAKQRLMTASFDYFALRYPHEGLKGGFIYKTVPHVTLKSIANNPDIDAIYERLHPAIDAALAKLNAGLAAAPPAAPLAVLDGARKGQKLAIGNKGVALLEWEVPFDYPPDWPASARAAFDGFHAARQKMQAEMDRSIAAQADNETLYDQPEKAKDKLRITGPFTVEAVPFPTVLSLDQPATQAPTAMAADLAIARSGATSRQHGWRDELLKTGIRGKGGQMLKFAELEVLPGTTCLHASGHLDSGERVVVSFGPEHGALEQRQVEHALREAGELFPLPKMIVFCAFMFDPEAAKDIDALKGITALKAQMNPDMLTEDLKKARSSNQSFWLMGQPDVLLSQTKAGLWQVEVNGFDYFDTAKGELVSGGKGKIAAWSLDTDYDGRSLFPHQVFFPMAGKDGGWLKLKKNIRAELDEDLLSHFVGTVSLPFEAGTNHTVAVKIVDDRGIESLKVMRLEN